MGGLNGLQKKDDVSLHSSCHHSYLLQDRMILQQLKQAYMQLLHVLIVAAITNIGFYILFGRYWALVLHHDPDREILFQLLIRWVESDEL